MHNNNPTECCQIMLLPRSGRGMACLPSFDRCSVCFYQLHAVACINVFDYDWPSSPQHPESSPDSASLHMVTIKYDISDHPQPECISILHVTITSTTEISARAHIDLRTYAVFWEAEGSALSTRIHCRSTYFVRFHYSLHPTEKLWHLKGFYVWKVTFVKRCFYVSFETTAANPFFQYLSRLLH